MNRNPLKRHHIQATKDKLLRPLALLCALTISLGGIVALVHDEILGPVVFAAGEVLVEDGLRAVGVSLQSH